MNFLSPLGILFGRIIDLRNLLYDRGTLKTYSLGAKTICVGNLTTGGTGKTPLVVLIAELLAENGEKVCILTRGYGRDDPKQRVLVSDGKSVLVDAKTGGDEPIEIATKLLGKAIVLADADRVAAAKWANTKFGVTAFVLDDGFQHRRAKRDVDILCIDATDPFGNEKILPAGSLRESLKGLGRADAIVITRADLVNDTAELEDKLKDRNTDARIFKCSTRIVKLIDLNTFYANTQATKNENNQTLLAFCGIGNPENFFATMRLAGYELSGTEAFPDHHRYTQSDIDQLEKEGPDGFVTTAKDAVKLKGLKFGMPCFVAEAETIIDDAAALRELVLFS